MNRANGNEVSSVGPGLSLNSMKNRSPHRRRRLARLDPNLCRVPDFAVQVLTRAVKAGSAEILQDHYKVCGLWTCQGFDDLIARFERDAPVHGMSDNLYRLAGSKVHTATTQKFSAQLMQRPCPAS